MVTTIEWDGYEQSKSVVMSLDGWSFHGELISETESIYFDISHITKSGIYSELSVYLMDQLTDEEIPSESERGQEIAAILVPACVEKHYQISEACEAATIQIIQKKTVMQHG